MLVAIQIVRASIIRYIKIGPAVVVVIAPHYSHSVVEMFIVHARFFRDVLEGSIASIVKQEIAFTLHTPLSALHQNATETAEFLVAAQFWKLIHIYVDVARNEQIYTAIAIVVSPGGP